MVDSNSGKWVLGLVVYYFLFFLIVWSSIGTVTSAGISTNMSIDSGGIQDRVNPFSTAPYCDTPQVNAKLFGSDSCADTNAITYASCNSLYNCNWTNESTVLYFFSYETEPYCSGTLNYTIYGASDNICDGLLLDTDRGLCSMMGCTWYNYENLGKETTFSNSGFNIKSIWDSVTFMTGFNADVGVSGLWRFIISFVFFYIPLLVLLLAIYFALPFI